jgi:outer membrane receptor protein involved in Fe transport
MLSFKRRPLFLLLAGLLPQIAMAETAAENSPGKTVEPETLPTVQVTAQRLKSAQIRLSPSVGTTVYHVDRSLIDSLGQGDSTPFDQLLLHLPGVDADSKGSGSIHVRDDHGNVQYRVDGVQLPDTISGFGSMFDTRYINSMDFLTGALPAQYGLHTAGVVDIRTRTGDIEPGGSVGIMVGSHDTVQPSFSLYGGSGRVSYFLTGSNLQSSRGIENPQATSSATHDETTQSRVFGNVQYFADDSTRVGLMFGAYRGRYQIPTNPDQDAAFSLNGYSDVSNGVNNFSSSEVDEHQTETSRFFALSLQRSVGDWDYQGTLFNAASTLHYYPDAVGDLIFNGVASNSYRSNTTNGLQFDAARKLNSQHTLRFGTELQVIRTTSRNEVSLFAADEDGNQTSSTPFTLNDDSSKTGTEESLYAQDEWHLTPELTLNYGLRFDHVNAYTNEQQLSPRVNIAWQATPDTLLHAGYARYFTLPPQELESQSAIDTYAGTTNAPAISQSDNVKAERTHYFDIGASQKLTPSLTVAADMYYKIIRNLIDEGQFGQALILSPFNYEKGFARGVELSATYAQGNWNAYANLAFQQAKGKNIVSGQSLFEADELAYISNHYVNLDHDQTWTLSTGVSYRFGANRVSTDMLFGTGMRATPDGGAPNSASLADYTVFNAGYTHTWQYGAKSEVEARLAVLNIFDHSYLLRDGTGIGVGAPQYGARRTLYTGVTLKF